MVREIKHDRLVLQKRIADSATKFETSALALTRHADAESVHAVRVSARRLQALLWSMKSCIRRGPRRIATECLKDIAGHLGGMRDADVLRDTLKQITAEAGLSVTEQQAVDLALRRRAAAVRLDFFIAVRSPQYSRDCRQVMHVLTNQASFRHSMSRAPQRIRKKVFSSLKRLGRESHRARRRDIHRIRLLVKHCRYSLDELAIPSQRRQTQRLETLQDLLGKYCDARLATEWLKDPQSLQDQALRRRLTGIAKEIARHRATTALRELRR